MSKPSPFGDRSWPRGHPPVHRDTTRKRIPVMLTPRQVEWLAIDADKHEKSSADGRDARTWESIRRACDCSARRPEVEVTGTPWVESVTDRSEWVTKVAVGQP
jgi:hypothetical protein